jgi:hypothetical protein
VEAPVVPLQPFYGLTAGEAPITNAEISAPVFLARCKIWSMQQNAWPKQCIEQKQVVAPVMHSEFEAKHLNPGISQSFFRLQHTPRLMTIGRSGFLQWQRLLFHCDRQSNSPGEILLRLQKINRSLVNAEPIGDLLWTFHNMA